MNHLMNTNTNPAAASASSSRDNPCYGSDPTVATLNVFADDERSYQLPYAQFLYAELIPNPVLEKNSDAPPEQLLISFAVGEVTVFGSGLKSLERAIQKYELKFVKAADRRYAAALKTHVAAVVIDFNKETP
jgi:hypothetical protein